MPAARQGGGGGEVGEVALRLARRRVSHLLVAVLLAVAACDEAPQPSAGADRGPPEPARPEVGLVMKTLTNPFFAEMERGARRAAAALGVDLVARNAAQETSIEQQIAIVDGLVAAGVDAIVIAPSDSSRLIPVLKKAADRGVVVINVDNALDPALARSFGLAEIPFVSVDNEAGAFKSAGALVAARPEGGDALIIEGIRGAENAEARRRGALRAFDAAGNVTVVASETGNWKIDEGYAVAKQAFTARPAIKLVFAANDMMALGAVRYLDEAGRDDVVVAGYDALAEAERAIIRGDLVATIDQQAAEQGYRGVEYAVRALNGGAVPAVTLLDTLLITRASLGQ